jgi:hypothetical protein
LTPTAVHVSNFFFVSLIQKRADCSGEILSDASCHCYAEELECFNYMAGLVH